MNGAMKMLCRPLMSWMGSSIIALIELLASSFHPSYDESCLKKKRGRVDVFVAPGICWLTLADWD